MKVKGVWFMVKHTPFFLRGSRAEKMVYRGGNGIKAKARVDGELDVTAQNAPSFGYKGE